MRILYVYYYVLLLDILRAQVCVRERQGRQLPRVRDFPLPSDHIRVVE